MATLIFLFCQLTRQLTDIFHRELATIGSAIYPSCDVIQLTVFKTYKRMWNGSDARYIGKMHRKILHFGKMLKLFRLWLQNIFSSHNSNDGKALWAPCIVMFYVHGQFCLNTSYGSVATDNNRSKFVQVLTGIWQNRSLIYSKEFLSTM